MDILTNQPKINYFDGPFNANQHIRIVEDIGFVGLRGDVNYDQFIYFTDKRVVKLDSSNKEHGTRTVNRNNLKYAVQESIETSGYHTIRNLDYKIQEESSRAISLAKNLIHLKQN